MRHPCHADELLEVSGNELRSVVGDDSRFGFRVFLSCSLQDDFDLRFGHRFPQIPMNDRTAVAIQNAAQVIERTAHVDVGNIDVPMLVGMRWLLETSTLARRLTLPSREQPGLLEYAPNAGGADRHDVSVQHHKRQSPIAFQRMFSVEADDRLLLPRRQPKIAGNPTVVFIDASVALSPVVELAGAHAQPVDESSGADLRLFRPAPDKIHHQVPHIVRHPHLDQSSPRLFFKAMCSAISSASTSSLVWIFFSRNSIRCCSAWWSGRLLPWKAAAPFSKNSFCQRYNTVGCSPSSSHRSETGTLSNKCRLRMATFSSPVYCFRPFLMRPLRYLNG